MKNLFVITVILLIALSVSLSAQDKKKEVKTIPAAKIIPAPNQPSKAELEREPKLKDGMMVPDFEVPSMEDPSVKYSKEGMMGKVYMIDFWATWCGPCVGEMKTLHEAYNKFKNKGLEIISFSCDAKPEDVAPFRKDRWPMPWKHVFFGRGKECLYPKIKEDFDLRFIPSPFLIDKTGKIVAMGDELRGEKLIKTLEKFFD